MRDNRSPKPHPELGSYNALWKGPENAEYRTVIRYCFDYDFFFHRKRTIYSTTATGKTEKIACSAQNLPLFISFWTTCSNKPLWADDREWEDHESLDRHSAQTNILYVLKNSSLPTIILVLGLDMVSTHDRRTSLMQIGITQYNKLCTEVIGHKFTSLSKVDFFSGYYHRSSWNKSGQSQFEFLSCIILCISELSKST